MTSTHSIAALEKKSIRAKILHQRKNLSREEVLLRSRKIEEKLIGLKEYIQSKRILFYVSMPGEVDTHKIIQDFLKSKKHVVVPITNKADRNLFLSEIDSFPVGLHPSTYGVLEPELGDKCHLYEKDIDLIIMPGVAFDPTGHRLGHGGGYYDRFLKSFNLTIPRIALAFDFQIFENLPKEIWDVPVHIIVTESKIIHVPHKNLI